MMLRGNPGKRPLQPFIGLMLAFRKGSSALQESLTVGFDISTASGG